MKTVLVGISPTTRDEAGQALSSLISSVKTGGRLASLIGITPERYMEAFDRVNVYPLPHPTTVFDLAPYAENLCGVLRGRQVVLLGHETASSFGLRDYRFMSWKAGTPGLIHYRSGQNPPFDWAVVPHPSGRNRWYNDLENVKQVKDFFQSLIQP